MSDIAKNLFEKNPNRWFDGYNTLEEHNDNMFCFEGKLHGYLLILNPDTGDKFDNRLNELEIDQEDDNVNQQDIGGSLNITHGGDDPKIGSEEESDENVVGEGVNDREIEGKLSDLTYDFLSNYSKMIALYRLGKYDLAHKNLSLIRNKYQPRKKFDELSWRN